MWACILSCGPVVVTLKLDVWRSDFINLFVDGSKAKSGAPFFKGFPLKIRQHGGNALSVVVVVKYEAGCSALDFLQCHLVVLVVRVPYSSTILQLRADQGFICSFLHLFTTEMDISSQKPQHFVCLIYCLVNMVRPVEIIADFYSQIWLMSNCLKNLPIHFVIPGKWLGFVRNMHGIALRSVE